MNLGGVIFDNQAEAFVVTYAREIKAALRRWISAGRKRKTAVVVLLADRDGIVCNVVDRRELVRPTPMRGTAIAKAIETVCDRASLLVCIDGRMGLMSLGPATTMGAA